MQLLCNGGPRNIGYTNLKGQFNIDLTDRNNSSRLNDASQGGASQGGASQSTASWDGSGIGNTQNSNGSPGTLGQSRIGFATNFLGCELLAELPGFRSDHVDLYNRHSLDNPEVGTLVLHRLANVQGLTISATTALAPKDAKKAFEKGRNAEKKEKWDEAETEFRKAVDQYPKFASAWYELGFVQQKKNNVDAARKSYARSLEADPKFINPYGQLAALAMREQKWDEVADATFHLLQLNPVDFPMDWYYNAIANLQLQKLDIAEKSAREGIGADPNHGVPQLNYVLGVILAQKHDYPGALDNLRAYLLLAPKATNADTARKQLAEVEKLATPLPAKP
jgi:Flp pilus assembly protein TadD